MPMTTCRACNDDDDDYDGGSETVGAATGVYPRRKSIRRRVYIYIYILVHTRTHSAHNVAHKSRRRSVRGQKYTHLPFFFYLTSATTHPALHNPQSTAHPCEYCRGKKDRAAQNPTTRVRI